MECNEADKRYQRESTSNHDNLDERPSVTEPNSNVCCIEGCGRKYRAKGYCLNHYVQARRRSIRAVANYKRLTCAQCGIEFQSLRKKKYCGTACGLRANHAKRYTNPKHYRAMATCHHCSVVFKPKAARYSTYCSKTCAGAARTARSKDEHPLFSTVYAGYCLGCGKAFVSKHKRLYCSDECKPKYISRALTPTIKTCSRCGIEFAYVFKGGGFSHYCGVECKAAVTREANRTARQKYGNKNRNRARNAGVAYEPVNKIKVFDRDGWRCQICGKPTPRARLGGMTTNAPELDHRVPLSKGGGHLYSNVQCACRQCNGRKGNKASTGQLPMFEAVG